MAQYSTTWLDYQLPTGTDYSVAVCGYSGLIRQIVIGKDPLRRMMTQPINVINNQCSSSKYCIALKCPLNQTDPRNLAYMLDMSSDEELDEETASAWGTSSTVEGLVKFAEQLNENLPDKYKALQNSVQGGSE